VPQVEMISALLWGGVTKLVCEWGRQTGKTEGLIALFGIWGQMNPGSQSYYFAPLLTQAREIIWVSGRILKILPSNWIDDFKETESRLYFSSSRFCYLKVDGCDKVDRSRGIAPTNGLVALDECRDMRESMIDVVMPALKVGHCSLVATSSPPEDLNPYPREPERLHWFCEFADEARNAPQSKYLHFATVDNPHFPKEELAKERARYEGMGKLYIYEREYEGRRVYGKTGYEYPMLKDTQRYIFPHYSLMEEIRRSRGYNYEWYCMTDPAGSGDGGRKSVSAWAWLFIAINKHTRKIYFLDEIYEQDKARMATTVLWPEALVKMMELHDIFESWRCHYDEAETWFANQMAISYRVSFSQSFKASKSREEGIRLWSDIFLGEQACFSDRCVHTFWEFSNYQGLGSRRNHCVDLGRYVLNVSSWSQVTKPEGEPPVKYKERPYLKHKRQTLSDEWQEVDVPFSGVGDML
jgi:hypothetical protein